MSNSTRYIEIASSYRDRSQYPNPAEFTIPISMSGQKSVESAIDPVSDTSPVLYWNTSFTDSPTASATSITLNATPIIVGISAQSTLILQSNGGAVFRGDENFYVGAVLVLTNGSGNVYRRITSSTRLSNDTLKVTLLNPIPDFTTFTGGSITNPTTDTTTPGSSPQLFLPGSENIDSFYTNYIAENLTTQERRTITAFDANTRLATLDSITGTDWRNANHNIVVRKKIPFNSGTIFNIDLPHNIYGGISNNLSVVQLNNTIDVNINLEKIAFYRLSVPTNNPPNITDPYGDYSAPYGNEYRIIKYRSLNTTILNTGATFIQFTDGSDVDGFYDGCLITNVTNTGIYTITNYVGATKTANVNSIGASVIGDTIYIRSAFLNTPINPAPSTAGASVGYYEIELIDRDNFNPFFYNGTLVSSQQTVCYEIELINLILPNTTLVSGGRAVYYPYLYVKFENETAGNGNSKGSIYSNNPHSINALFRAVVDDNTAPLVSPFIKIDSDGMVQTVKFKPNDNLSFGVYLPGGSVFQTEEQDTSPPSAPNPLVQISALFSIRRI